MSKEQGDIDRGGGIEDPFRLRLMSLWDELACGKGHRRAATGPGVGHRRRRPAWRADGRAADPADAGDAGPDTAGRGMWRK